ncbi:MAG TPA: Calx-beta domain-containing protein, partial [Gemmataceae bacterium]|nr:Calx-beta domain-containing protein [Gemmataceae bacterium]
GNLNPSRPTVTNGRLNVFKALSAGQTGPGLSISDASVTEGNTGTVGMVFTVTLSAPSTQPVTVNFATANGTAGASDYVSASDTLTFAPGETSKTITVQVIGDVLNEANETFFVNLSSPVNATIADGQGVGTILDDDPAPSLTIGDVSLAEGNRGTTPFIFTVTLSAASGQTVTVNYATANGTATTSNSDYTAKSGTLTFAPGETSKTITISVRGDRRIEANETFFVNLTGPTNATLADGQGVGTILNDD